MGWIKPESKVKLGDWIDLVIEYKPGTISVNVNGDSKTNEDESGAL